ncbi:MAG TPA: Hsp33 family molecular chaperone HslO [Treponemataceae bacterium]|nr:Hsp33 family molecular chaperone HslO [Treponemataceae bacterium]
MVKATIKDTDLLQHIDSLYKDEMEIFTMADGLYRGAFFHGTSFVNQMRAQHNLGILETMILGQASLCAALMIATMKGREQLLFRYDCTGPAAGFSVEADSTGWVRGFLLQNPIPIEKPLENWNLSPFIGSGTVRIFRYTEGAKTPQKGTTEIKYQNIAKDVTWYYLQSEQTPTAFNTSIQLDKKGRVIGAGGLFLQRMPIIGGKKDFCEDETDAITLRVENALNAAPSFGEWFSQKGNLEDIIFGLFREFKPLKALTRQILWECPCTKESFLQSIKHLTKNEVDAIIKNGTEPLEVVCHNCASVYSFATKEL